MAKNLIFGYLDHSKMIFHGFWMIHYVQYCYQNVKDIKYYQNLQYEVHPTDQTQDIDPKEKGSFKNFSYLIEKSIKNQPDFSRTCGFRVCSRESLNFHFKPSITPNQWLDFCQNLFKVEKPLKMAVFGTVS